jgi:O-antigen ligase
MTNALRKSPALPAARYLMAAVMVGLLFSPPLANLCELALALLFAASPDLRKRIAEACRQPMVIATLVFFMVLSAGFFYGIATPSAGLNMWSGWRKLLLLPLAVALFDETRAKYQLILVLVIATTLFAMASYLSVFTNHVFYPEDGVGITVRNHATQGMMFAVAAFAVAGVLSSVADLQRACRVGLGISALLLVANIVLVTPGRSGYLVLLVCGTVFVLGMLVKFRKLGVKAYALGGVALAMLVLALALSPVSRDKITQGIEEVRNYQKSTEVTSMGIRVIFWKNALEIIAERPWFGYGMGSFETAYRRKVEGLSGVEATLSGDPHNQFMKITAEHGLFGLAAFLIFIASAFRQPASSPYRMLGLGVLSAWCATSLFNSHFSTFVEGSFIALWCGAMLAQEKQRTGPADSG